LLFLLPLCGAGEPWARLFSPAPAPNRFFPIWNRSRTSGLFTLYQHNEWLLGEASIAINSNIESATAKLYENLLQASAGHSLCRVWITYPPLTPPAPGAEENYRLFCLARSEAIESVYGSDFPQKLPAASAVGTDSDQLSVLFAAHKNVPRHFENPAQVPAYDYPPEHGPRSPSFARATVLTNHSSKTTFISGTAAIKGHASCFPNNTHAQLHCTLDNLRIISDTCGLGPDLAASSARSAIKVYLRNAQDLDSVAAALSETLLLPTDQVIYLRSDICRAELTIEIEATILESSEPNLRSKGRFFPCFSPNRPALRKNDLSGKDPQNCSRREIQKYVLPDRNRRITNPYAPEDIDEKRNSPRVHLAQQMMKTDRCKHSKCNV